MLLFVIIDLFIYYFNWLWFRIRVKWNRCRRTVSFCWVKRMWPKRHPRRPISSTRAARADAARLSPPGLILCSSGEARESRWHTWCPNWSRARHRPGERMNVQKNERKKQMLCKSFGFPLLLPDPIQSTKKARGTLMTFENGIRS